MDNKDVSALDQVTKPVGFAIPTNDIRIEPRCRICRDEGIRNQVNELLKWHGVPIPMGGGKFHHVTYASILRYLEPLNADRDGNGRITYASLWVHAKRHVDVVWTSADLRAWIINELGKPTAEDGVPHT